MAKQTFTTGQVLTAAQMTSLQQTAMLGGAASAKTASYTLVAADAGTAITMSNASATTITVNTALFAAGDTVQITNLGAGVCTITAGTATVNTASSLALAQYESGTLDFTSTSAAVFIKAAGAAVGGGGKVLQVVHANTSSTTTITSTTFTDIGLTASITPSAITSKVLVLLDISQCASRTTNVTVDVRSQLLRGATVVPTSGQMVNGISAGTSSDSGATQVYGYVGMSLLDTPATTSSTTYKVQGRLNTTASSAQAVFNGTQQGPTSVSSITLLEIGA
jgi:hypothetical protein